MPFVIKKNKIINREEESTRKCCKLLWSHSCSVCLTLSLCAAACTSPTRQTGQWMIQSTWTFSGVPEQPDTLGSYFRILICLQHTRSALYWWWVDYDWLSAAPNHSCVWSQHKNKGKKRDCFWPFTPEEELSSDETVLYYVCQFIVCVISRQHLLRSLHLHGTVYIVMC